MNGAERRLVLGLAAAVAVLAAVLAVVTLAGRSSNNGTAAATSTHGPTSTPTPPSPVPTSTAAPVTTTTTPPGAVSTTTAAPVVAVREQLTGAGAVLAPPPAPDVRTEDAPNDCASLVDSGWDNLDCKVVEPGTGGLTYVIEIQPAPAYIATRAYIFRRTPAGSEQVILEAADDSGARYVASEVEAAVEPVNGASAPVIVVGFLEGNGARVAVDVVQSPGVVAVHRDLWNGAVVPEADQLETWSGPVGGGTGPYTHDTVRMLGGTWWVVARQAVPAAAVPHSRNVLA